MLTSDRILINAGPRCKKAQEQFRPAWAPCYMSQGIQSVQSREPMHKQQEEAPLLDSASLMRQALP